jgi:hypothetical protein
LRFSGGNDVLLFPEDVPLALDEKPTKIRYLRTPSSVKKILKFKYRRLEFCQPINIKTCIKTSIRLKMGAKLRIV